MSRPANEPLAVYLGDECVGTLEQPGPTRVRFRYSREASDRYGDGALILSASLPVRSEPFPNAAAKPFFDGLLPEGPAREAVARKVHASPDNVVGLLRALGEDCAGAVVLRPQSSDPPAYDNGGVTWLSDEDLADRIAQLPVAPLGIDPGKGVRLSLAGVQRKLVLVRSASGRWGQPTGGAPSSHIVKPRNPDHPGLVANEAFCMRVAQCCGLDVAEAQPMALGGAMCLVAARLDRSLRGARTVRLHQEDFCQALGVAPALKYENEGGPSAADCVALLRDLAGPSVARSILSFVRSLFFNFIIGNSDAHGKNYALLYEELGRPRLAPLYDLVSTQAIPGLTSAMAMAIGGETDPDKVDRASWLRLAADVGVGRGMERQLDELASRAFSCCRATRELAAAEGWFDPIIDVIVELAERRVRQCSQSA